MRRFYISSFLASALLTVSACAPNAPVYWQHSTIPSEQWRSDQRACTRAAERHLGLDPSLHAGQAGLSEYQESMRVYDVSRKTKSIVADCMRQKGYQPVK